MIPGHQMLLRLASGVLLLLGLLGLFMLHVIGAALWVVCVGAGIWGVMAGLNVLVWWSESSYSWPRGSDLSKCPTCAVRGVPVPDSYGEYTCLKCGQVFVGHPDVRFPPRG